MSIRFLCNCGYEFDVPQELEHTELQCPECRRLVDVPTLAEINALEPDGTFKLDAAAPPPSALKEKLQAFAHRDDLRHAVDDFLAIGVPSDEPAAPRYDPVTGEMVVPYVVQHDPASAKPVLPIRKPSLGYSSVIAEQASGKMHWYQLPWRLLMGISLVSMCFVFLPHLFIQLLMMMPAINIFVFPLAVVMMLGMVAHYGNVIEEFGPRESNRVPILMRNVSFSEDIVMPLQGIVIAFLFCFFPLLLAAFPAVRNFYFQHPPVFFALGLIGLFLFPATVLTLIAGGDLHNLMPKRLFSVIRAAPLRYLLACAAFIAGLAAYVFVVGSIIASSVSLIVAVTRTVAWTGLFQYLLVINSALVVAIYLMHLATAWLGLIYRDHYSHFDWVYQRHHNAERSDTLAKLRDMRRSGDPRLLRRRGFEPRPVRPVNEPRPVLPIDNTTKQPRGFDAV